MNQDDLDALDAIYTPRPLHRWLPTALVVGAFGTAAIALAVSGGMRAMSQDQCKTADRCITQARQTRDPAAQLAALDRACALDPGAVCFDAAALAAVVEPRATPATDDGVPLHPARALVEMGCAALPGTPACLDARRSLDTEARYRAWQRAGGDAR